ncbi:MAG: 50S ribosomal protein L18 [Bacteroidetes bacterium]|jgi:large subunit ribosomal protein L18|nr:50S ribosomal protein L18 [Bacteroidota bacterium]MBL0016373.1 50S ribosomal protein L18 [Bacteroidota bacterium]MBP6720772.1 50S ribosomal protein L18 [Bacteroidia bacterium]
MAANDKSERRTRIKKGIRKKISGTNERPRLSVFRSNKEIYVQVINDLDQKTLVGTSSRAKSILEQSGTKTEISRLVGLEIARLAKEKGIEAVVFDRNGFNYHGRLKALADGAREGGLSF